MATGTSEAPLIPTKQEKIIVYFERRGGCHSTDDGRRAEITIDLVLQARAKMFENKVTVVALRVYTNFHHHEVHSGTVYGPDESTKFMEDQKLQAIADICDVEGSGTRRVISFVWNKKKNMQAGNSCMWEESEQYTHKYSTYRVAQHDHIASREHAWLKSWKAQDCTSLCPKTIVIHLSCLLLCRT